MLVLQITNNVSQFFMKLFVVFYFLLTTKTSNNLTILLFLKLYFKTGPKVFNLGITLTCLYLDFVNATYLFVLG